MRVLVVDGANVVGSRPDGWWRDRAGAARRLWDRLASADLPYDEVVLVLEGAAKQGVPVSAREGHALVAHARRAGDDAIVDEVIARAGVAEVTVVTADRGLTARVHDAGASVVRPSWLIDRL